MYRLTRENWKRTKQWIWYLEITRRKILWKFWLILKKEHQRQAHIIKINQTKEYEELEISHTAEHVRAYIKVQDGCNQFCTYCIIPYARGRVRSREKENILNEVHKLAKAGYKEVVLTGIHLSSYGVDFPEDKKETLLSLIQAVNEVEGIQRIRLVPWNRELSQKNLQKSCLLCQKSALIFIFPAAERMRYDSGENEQTIQKRGV